MTRLIRAVVFDFGGVLIDWNPRYLYRKLFPGDEAAMERFLSEISFLDWNAQMDSGRDFATAVGELCERFPAHAHLIRAYHERWEEAIGGPIPETVDVLRELDRAGVELHGLTNWSHETFVVTRPRYDFFKHFRTIVVSGEEKVMKPDPRIFARLLERIGRQASECLFIDDLPANVAAARQLGFDVIQFESAERLRAELQRRRLLDPASDQAK
jgi:2-haloacid dehalogenase